MQRSRSRKLARLELETQVRPAQRRFAKLIRHASIGAAVMAAVSAARAQQADTSGVGLSASSAQVQQADADATSPAPAPDATGTASTDQGGLQEVIVTATKRAENIQSIPMTVTAITGASLQNQNIQNIENFAMEMPQVSIESTGNPGQSAIFMRGINGTAGGFSGQQASVAVYLDEQPITTPNGEVDWHMYDMSRVEVLPGPQGTLYGAESEAGTIRYITNQPDTTHFSAGYTTQLNTIYNGTLGGIAEGFINVPFSSNIAARFVGWYERDSGYIDNVPQTITFADGDSINNAKYVQNHYDPITTEGGRAEFKFAINDNWSINPAVQTQKQRWTGIFGVETWKDFADGPAPASGLTVSQFNPETSFDSALDYTLTVLGKIGNFDLTLASSYETRHTGDYQEYVDYSLAYEQYETGPSCPACWPKNPSMYRVDGNSYQYISNELRIASPVDWPVHFIAGLYQDREQGLNFLDEPIPGLDPTYQVGYGTNFIWNNTVYLDDLQSVFRDWAAYIQTNWDITSHLTATVGFRRFRYDNTITGFYGYSTGYVTNLFGETSGGNGEESCFSAYRFNNSPCEDEDQQSEGWGSTPLFTLSYKFDPDRMVYATFSKGFRPGGPNRTAGAVPYGPDYLTNYEVGWKTAWFDHHLIFNGDVYYEQWQNFQFSYTGANGINVIANAGDAVSKGVESQLTWLVMRGLQLTASLTYTDAYLTENYCGLLGSDGKPITSGDCTGPGVTSPSTPLAADGQKLPYDALWKAFLSARYSFPFANGTAFVEGDQSYQSFMWTQLEPVFNEYYGVVPAYGLTNFSLGLDKNNWELELLVTNAFNRITATNQNAELLTGAEYVATFNIIAPPRLIGIQFSQNF